MNTQEVSASVPAEPTRLNKVLKLRILKPADDRTWGNLGALLREVRYRVYRLANLYLSEMYLGFHRHRTGDAPGWQKPNVSELNKRLLEMLGQETQKPASIRRLGASGGALFSCVTDALSQNKLRALTARTKWIDVLKGKSSLPTFRLNMAVPVRADKSQHRRLVRQPDGSVTLDLMLCPKPHPRVLLATQKIGDGAAAVLDRLLNNPSQCLDGYRQRSFEIKEDARTRKWWLYVSYDFPKAPSANLCTDIVVGVDLGFSTPIYAAISNGHARLGHRAFAALAARIRSLQRQTLVRRRSIQSGGRASVSAETARSGHGVTRKLLPTQRLQGRIDDAYTTLNHQLSRAVVDFARNHGAGVIQMENLDGLKERLSGTFLGQRWRYHQLQQFLKYKAEEVGIEVRQVSPRMTSRRCSACGHIHESFDRAARDRGADGGFKARFVCSNPKCGHTADPDYNAARNLATLDIERIIREQCVTQGISCRSLETDDDSTDPPHTVG
ncbi:MAG: hypothetical protein FLDDKLPJ_02606 [Phycisphaerae bacterium]|nr:hypothetical protein [Phycisphaerae bacterium]